MKRSQRARDRSADKSLRRRLRYELPDARYLQFVRSLSWPGLDETLPDPFAVSVPAERFRDLFIQRIEVSREIEGPGCMIILGEEGIGKTSLVTEILSNVENPARLAVSLDLNRVSMGPQETEILAGKLSVLTPRLLAAQVFDAYWEQAIQPSETRACYLQQMRRDRGWMEALRLFYHQFPPAEPEIEPDFELMAWLRASSGREPDLAQASPSALLRRLLELVTKSPTLYGSDTPLQTFRTIEVLVDGTERLSPSGLSRLIDDMERLYQISSQAARGKRSGSLGFKLFLDSVWAEQAGQADCVRQGRLRIVRLPLWKREDLQQLLRLRLYAARQGGSSRNPEALPEYNLGSQFAHRLTRSVRSTIEASVVEAADGLPLEALLIARGVVAAAAGCWEEYSPPLQETDIQDLIRRYRPDPNS